MNVFIESAIRVSVLMGVALLATELLRQRSAALRHWVLAVTVVGALAMPLVTAFGPSWTLPVDRDAQSIAPRPAPLRGTSARAPISTLTSEVVSVQKPTVATSIVSRITALLQPLWLAGAALYLGGLLVGLWRLTRVAARARALHDGPWTVVMRRIQAQYKAPRSVRLLQSEQPALLVTWGLVSPQVILPDGADTWAEDRMQVVLAHELAHVQRGDWAVQIAGELLRAMYWFNPLVWLTCARLRDESERACDDAVVNLGVPGRDYASHLLALARMFGSSRPSSFPAVAIAPRPSRLERRVSAMLNSHLSRHPVSRRMRVAVPIALLAVALPIALFAQNRFSTLSGSIVDESNAFLPGVIVVAADAQRGARHEVRTNRNGHFELVGLPQGSYSLTAQLPGFESFQQTLALDGQDMNHDITLRIGSLQETIAVSLGGTPSSSQNGPYAPRPPNCGPGQVGNPRIGGQIRTPRKLYHVSPIYPPGTAAPATVKLEAIIGVEGLVTEVKSVNDAPTAFVRSATDAVRQWRFDPTLLNCAPVEVRMAVLVDYR